MINFSLQLDLMPIANLVLFKSVNNKSPKEFPSGFLFYIVLTVAVSLKKDREFLHQFC